MAFTIREYNDLIRLLREHPEWRKELRQLLLSDELLTLPELVQQLVHSQQRAEERLSRLEVAVQRLTEQVSELTKGQKELKDTVSGLKDTVGELEDTVGGVKDTVGGLKDTVGRLQDTVGGLQNTVGGLQDTVGGLQDTVGGLQDTVGGLQDTVGGLKGDVLEIKYRNKALAHFGRLLNKPKVIELYTLIDRLEESLTSDEFDEIFLTDLVVAGNPRHVSDSPHVYMVIEISSVIDRNDVSRAIQRANLFRKSGYRAVPAVAGEDVTQGANEAIQEYNVLLVQDGRMEFWKEALANWEDIQLEEDRYRGTL